MPLYYIELSMLGFYSFLQCGTHSVIFAIKIFKFKLQIKPFISRVVLSSNRRQALVLGDETEDTVLNRTVKVPALGADI